MHITLNYCVLYLFCIQPGVNQRKQGVLVVQVQVSQQGLDGHGGHFFTACRVVVDYDQGQRGEEQAAVLQQQFLNKNTKHKHNVVEMTKRTAAVMRKLT